MNWLVRGALHTLWYWEAALVLVLAASALLLWSGLRGKRKGTTPYCRRCDYNLTALDRPICPECGADLRHRRAIVVGERHRRYGRLAMVPFALFAASYIVVGPLEPVWSFWDWYACSSFASLTSDLRG